MQIADIMFFGGIILFIYVLWKDAKEPDADM